ncbi:MAG: DVUA0089 family protein, partial [Pyrinomonadaceae bacterium]|nr:DVUA0089 family protein [Phycisphaerales bacterium]
MKPSIRLEEKALFSRTPARLLLRRAAAAGPGFQQLSDRSLQPLESRTFLSAAFDVVGLTALRADGSYAAVDGSNIGVAIIDTGLYSAHADISPNFVAWYDAVTRSSSGTPIDPNGHGTHVAGTAASRNPAIGVATQARLIGIRGLTSGSEPYPDHNPVLEGLRWVIDNSQQYNIRVVNLSLGSPSNLNGNLPASAYQPFFAELERLGITIVAASGNSYANYAAPGSATPGAYSTLTVANTWEDDGEGDVFGGLYGGGGDRFYAYEADAAADRFAATSQRSTLSNQVAAPGSTIYSTWNGDQGKLFNTISGTSMASPLVAGMVALMQDAAFTYGGVFLSPAQVRQIIRDTADDIVDYNVTTNARAEITVDANGRPSAGPLQSLAETGLTYKRVNVYRAIQQVRATVTGHPGDPTPPPPGSSDTNATIATAIQLPSLDGTRTYDFVGNIGTDGSVTPGNNDIDMFKIVLESPGIVTFDTSAVQGGRNFDAYLRLFSASGNQLAFSDDSGGTFYPTLSSVRLQPGTYYFGISSYNNAAYNAVTGSNATGGQSDGDYALTVSLTNPDPNGVFQGAVAVDSLSAFYNGLIGADLGQFVGTQDVDFFDIVAPDTGTLIIDVDTTSSPDDLADSYIRVFNSSGIQIGFNDDEIPNQILDSYLELPVVRGQRVYVAVSSYWNSNFNPSDPFDRSDQGPGGYYDLFLFFNNNDSNGSLNSAAVGTVGGSIAGFIGNDSGIQVGADGSKDVDFVSFTPSTSGLLDIRVTSPNGTLASVISLWQFNPSTQVASRLADTSGSASHLIIRATAGQTYYVGVTGLGNDDYNWF